MPDPTPLRDHPHFGVMTDEAIQQLRERNEERVRDAVRQLGARYVLAGTRKPNNFGYIPVFPNFAKRTSLSN